MKKTWILGLLFVVVFICKGDPLDHWAWRAPMPPGDNVVAIASGNGQFVAVGENGNIITSSDGTNWISRQIGAAINFNGIAYGNGLFVAVGLDVIDSYVHGAIYISTNAVDWTSVIDPNSIWWLRGVAYARKRAGPTLQNRRLPPRRLPDSANSCRFHSTPLQSRQRTAPLARSFTPLHSTLESSETGRMNRPSHASCRGHEARQLRPLRGNGFDGCRAK
jgi:hypothetical protein